MKTWILMLTFCMVAGTAGSFGAMRYAEAQAVVADPAPAPDGVSSSPAIAAVDWNPLHWDWPWILGTIATVIGGVVMLLRPIAAATKWTGDNWLLARLEWLLAVLVRVVMPKDYPKFPDQKVATSSGGKTGGVA